MEKRRNTGYSLDEINPHLEDYIYGCILSQLRKLSVSDYDYIKTELKYNDGSETPTDDEIAEYIFETFIKMIDDHYYLQKIQRCNRNAGRRKRNQKKSKSSECRRGTVGNCRSVG